MTNEHTDDHCGWVDVPEDDPVIERDVPDEMLAVGIAAKAACEAHGADERKQVAEIYRAMSRLARAGVYRQGDEVRRAWHAFTVAKHGGSDDFDALSAALKSIGDGSVG